MFPRFYLIAGLLALSFYSYAQYQGWNMFDDVANGRGGSGGSSSRIYHK